MIISELHITNCRELAEFALQTGQVTLTQAEHIVAIIARFTALSKLPKEQQIAPISTVGADIENLATIAEFTNRNGKLSISSAANIHRTLSELIELHNACLKLVASNAASEKSDPPASTSKRRQISAANKPLKVVKTVSTEAEDLKS
jgi:hypothetical protein